MAVILEDRTPLIRLDKFELDCPSSNFHHHHRHQSWHNFANERRKRIWVQISLLSIILLIAMYLVWFKYHSPVFQPLGTETPELLLVNIFFRHGDRAPDNLDFFGLSKLSGYEREIWTNGLGNLTDIGRFRMYNLGLELARRYRASFANKATNVIALSSPKARSIESTKTLLRGFFNLETTMEKGLDGVRLFNQCRHGVETSCNAIPLGTGRAAEWDRVNIVSNLLPTIESDYVTNQCLYAKKYPCPLISNASVDAGIRSIIGYRELLRIAEQDQTGKLDKAFLSAFNTMLSVVRQGIQPQLVPILKNLSYWIGKPLVQQGDRILRLHDAYEQMCLLMWQTCYANLSGYIQIAPLVTTMIESQTVALGRQPLGDSMVADYNGKKVILYSSHDTVLILLMQKLGIIKSAGPKFEQRFFDLAPEADDTQAVLEGLRVIDYGFTANFELWKYPNGFSFLKLLIYNKDDGKYEPIEFKTIQLGSVCRRAFESQFAGEDIEQFYVGSDKTLDKSVTCPFELWQKLTSHLMITRRLFNELCYNDGTKFRRT